MTRHLSLLWGRLLRRRNRPAPDPAQRLAVRPGIVIGTPGPRYRPRKQVTK